MAEIFTQLDTQETTDHQPLPESFRDFSSRDHRPEISATEETYSAIDQATGKNNVERLQACRTRAWFSVNLDDRHVRIATNNCRLRWCPICSRSLSKHREISVEDWLRHQHGPRFLTLTLKHSAAPLAFQIKWIYYYFRQLRKTKFFQDHVAGGIWFFQVKRSAADKCWHPHLHCLITGSFIPHKDLSELWCKITHGSFVVDIRSIRDENEISKYVARYSSRPAMLNEFTFDDRLEIVSALHGKRLCGKWGTGSCCDLSNKVKVDCSKWENVGKWSTVIKFSYMNTFAKLILHCWRTDCPLPLNVDLSMYDRGSIGMSVSDIPNLVMMQYIGDPSP